LERNQDPATYVNVEKLLRDTDPSVRSAAVEAATRCGGTRAIPALLKSLKDSAWEVRQSAVNALAALGDRSAVDGICALITDPDRDVRESAINALAVLNDRQAILPLVIALLDPESAVRSLASATLLKLDRHWEKNEDIRRIVPKIIAATKHQDYWVRFSADKVLERLKIDPKNLPVEAPAVPAEKAPAKAPEKKVEVVPPHPAIPALADMLFDRDRDMRLAAANALGQLRDHSTSSLLSAAVRDADVAVREAAQTALAALN
jgi:HEAT repeat protein